MIRFGWKCGLGVVVSAAALMAGCSSAPVGTGSGTEDVAETPSALTRQYAISLPRSAPFGDVAVGALVGNVSINDRAQLTMASGVPGVQLTPVIAANGEVTVGVSARVGAVVSRGKATLRSGATALSVTTASTLDRQQGGSASSIEEAANLDPAELKTLNFTFPDVSQGSREAFTRGPRVDLSPNRYGSLTVRANGSARLSSGVYRFDSLVVERDGLLDLDNSAGPIVVLVHSAFVYRGRIQETLPALPNVLFIHESTASAIVEGAFRGTLLAPNAVISVDAPVASRSHAGAFIGAAVIIHQDQIVQHRPFRPEAGPTCDVATFTHVQDHPFDRSRDTDNDLQGVSLSADRWYFTNANSQLCGLSRCTLSHVWSYPLGANINADPSNVKGNPWAGTYNHFGDIAFVPARAGMGDLLYIALEANRGNGGRGAIGFVSADLETHFGFARLGEAPLKAADQGESMPWVAFNRAEDRAYSSAFDSGWLNAYEVRPRADGGGIEAVHRRAVRFHDCATGSPAFVSRKQGADFSATGKLYISVDVQGGGVIVVDPQTGTIRDFARVNFDPNGEGEELEGVAIRNLDGGESPGVRGHLHVQMIQNEDLSNDDHYFKHLRADDFSKL